MPRPKLKARVSLKSVLFGHGDVVQGSYDPEGAIQVAASPLLKPALGVARRIGTTLIRRGIRGFFKRFSKQTARPGIGSAVTKGPLKVGKTVLLGKARPGIGKIAAGAGAAAGVGVVSAHKVMRITKTVPAPAPAPRPQSAPKKDERKCCPLGTKRMVCFKRGRVKPRKKAKPKKRKPAKKRKTRKTRRRRK